MAITPNCGITTGTDSGGHRPSNYALGGFKYVTTLGGAEQAGIPATGTTFYETDFYGEAGSHFDCPLTIMYSCAVNGGTGGIGGTAACDEIYAEWQTTNVDSHYHLLSWRAGAPLIIDWNTPGTARCRSAGGTGTQLLDNNNIEGGNVLGIGAANSRWLKGADKNKLVAWKYNGVDTVKQYIYDVGAGGVTCGAALDYSLNAANLGFTVSGWNISGENDISPDGTKIISDFNGCGSGCVHNLRVWDIYAHTSVQLDVATAVHDVDATFNPDSWNPDQCYLSADNSRAYCGGAGTLPDPMGQYLLAWNATTGAYVGKTRTASHRGRGHMIMRPLASGNEAVAGGAWGSASYKYGHTDLVTGTVTDMFNWGTAPVGGQADFRESMDGHNGGGVNQWPTPAHTLVVHDFTDSGCVTATGADLPQDAYSAAHCGANQIRTPTRMDWGVGGGAQRSALLADAVSGYIPPVPLNEIMVSDEANPGNNWRIAFHYNMASYAKDCGPCVNLSGDGKYVSFVSNFGDSANIYFTRIQIATTPASYPSATLTAPTSGTKSGTFAVSGTCAVDAPATCSQGEFFICDSNGANCVSLGVVGGAGPYSINYDSTGIKSVDGRYKFGLTVTDSNAHTADSSKVLVTVHNAVTPRPGARH